VWHFETLNVRENGVKQGEHTEPKAPGAEDIKQDVASDVLRTKVPAEFIDVEVAAEEVVVSQSQLTRDKNKFQGQTPIVEEDIAMASGQPMAMSLRF
jgi:hypothetical protein